MRSSRLVCAVLASLNVLAAAARFIPEGGDDLAARVPLPAEGARAERPRGGTVIFRPRGERPAPAPTSARTPRPPSAPPPAEAPIDRDAFAYLGTMTMPDGAIGYFLKNKATSHVYSSGTGDGELAILEASDKELLIEIHGTKYLVAR
jgi:hypothetical protein